MKKIYFNGDTICKINNFTYGFAYNHSLIKGFGGELPAIFIAIMCNDVSACHNTIGVLGHSVFFNHKVFMKRRKLR